FFVVILGLAVLPECRGHVHAAVVFTLAERGPVRVVAKMVLQFFADHAFERCLVRAARRYGERQRSGAETGLIGHCRGSPLALRPGFAGLVRMSGVGGAGGAVRFLAL